MHSSASLNHGRRCVEELDKFDHLMGWTFRELRGKRDGEEDDLDREIRSAKQQELSHTAFGIAVDVPSEFVAPVRSAPLKSDQKAAKQKSKKTTTTNVQSRVYYKRATGATASSAARSAAASPANSPSHKPTKKKSSHSSTSSLPRKDSEPVDFVYDVSVRRKLCEEIDSERAKTLQEAIAKEAQLRAVNKWIYDTADHRSGRKQAWNCSDHHRQQSHPRHVEAASSARTGNTARRAETKPTVRASSAASSRSSNSSTHSKSSKPVKSSIAPNVSEWRTQAFPVYPSPEIATTEWKRAEQQRRQQQWRETKDVHDTIDDFESRVHQLAI